MAVAPQISSKKNCLFLPSLPDEIIFESILTRLPVKSLVRFRCVCKSWRSSISDPRFIQNHLSLVKAHDGLDNWRVILQYPRQILKSCSLSNIFHEPYGYSVDLDFPRKKARLDVEIVGSCNGLVCLCFRERTENLLIVWNPSIRESKVISACVAGSPPLSAYGFGYCGICDDYKLVQLAIGRPLKPRTNLYSLRADSWKNTDEFPLEINSVPCSAKVVDGALNWGVHLNSENSWVIVCYDLAEERFGTVSRPDDISPMTNPTLRVLGGCLCILCARLNVSVDVWMMKEYGVKESWTKLVSVKYPLGLKSCQLSKAFCFMKYNGILMYLGKTLFLFNMDEKTYNYPVIFGVNDCHEADIYVESLVSPNAYKPTGSKTFTIEEQDIESFFSCYSELGR
ncbi:hypothetical protein SLEP1_g29756 [Rubroshorea leprosula]|uniref:F-box domain-containing protein n=1 Tax=Rubroshorea leprosula TaxID=152421 RepID=A0AAV5K704_9ROSI|nr:hypothetical protein SLEP1_g29756 [Rubroshorea leprosula]